MVTQKTKWPTTRNCKGIGSDCRMTRFPPLFLTPVASRLHPWGTAHHRLPPSGQSDSLPRSLAWWRSSRSSGCCSFVGCAATSECCSGGGSPADASPSVPGDCRPSQLLNPRNIPPAGPPSRSRSRRPPQTLSVRAPGLRASRDDSRKPR